MSLKRKEDNMADKGKKDKGKRETQKKSNLTLKEKRKQKKDKGSRGALFEAAESTHGLGLRKLNIIKS
jgi:hypothetical protein